MADVKSDSLKDKLTTFRTQLDENYSAVKPKRFANLMLHHGEVQVRLASGEIHSLHMGDKGILSNEDVVYLDREGQYIAIFWDQVESLWFHTGYKD